jgi:hypothetical protein
MTKKVSAFAKELEAHSEEFFLLLAQNLFMRKKYDFFNLVKERTGIDLDEDPETLNSLPVSINFLGNFWRFAACFKLENHRQEFQTPNHTSAKHFRSVVNYLDLSEHYFEKDKC